MGYNDNRSQPTSMKVDRASNSADKIIDYSYEYYDANGNNNNRIRQINDYVDGAYSTTYLYDNYNRLRQTIAGANSRVYQYDAWGNIKDFSGITLNYQTNANGAPATNRISSDSQGFSYTYDEAGNMTAGMGQSFAYDGANRLKTAGNGSSAYGYDGDGMRVRKTESGATTYYVKSTMLGQTVMEVSGTSIQRAYVYVGGKLAAMQATDGQFYWLHTNHLGNSRAMTDANGNLSYKGQFDLYGQPLNEWSSSGNTDLNSKKFTGYERDAATGLDYAGARMYNSTRGRFMKADPIGLKAADMKKPESLNLYSYVRNDPVNFVDPSGSKLEFWICENRGSFVWNDHWWTVYACHLEAGNDANSGSGSEREGAGSDKRTCSEINDERNRIKRTVVDDYLKKSGLDQFIEKKDSFKAGYMLTFKDPEEVRNYIKNNPQLFGGGGSVGGSAHTSDLEKYFGEGLGNVADWRTYKETTSTTTGLGNRSLQAVLYGSGAYVDTDKWNPYEGDVANWAMHFFGEFLGKQYINSWKRCPED